MARGLSERARRLSGQEDWPSATGSTAASPITRRAAAPEDLRRLFDPHPLGVLSRVIRPVQPAAAVVKHPEPIVVLRVRG
jgi:hypothetical protein